jgi:hypothetical protein
MAGIRAKKKATRSNQPSRKLNKTIHSLLRLIYGDVYI